jgi:uncharacterized protein (DUF849 family)
MSKKGKKTGKKQIRHDQAKQRQLRRQQEHQVLDLEKRIEQLTTEKTAIEETLYQKKNTTQDIAQWNKRLKILYQELEHTENQWLEAHIQLEKGNP